MTNRAALQELQDEISQVKNQMRHIQKKNDVLQVSEKKFRSFVENSLNCIQLIDQKGVITYSNRVIHAQKSEDVVGKFVLEFLDNKYKVQFREYVDRAFKGETLELGAKNVFGEYILNHFIPIVGNEEEIMLMTIDITNQQIIKLGLNESELKYRNLMQNIPGMIYRSYLNWSAEIITGSELISGHTREEINSMEENWLTIIHPDDKTKVLHGVSKLYQKAETLVQIYRIIDRQGVIRWVEDRNRSVFEDEKFKRIDGIVFDITGQMKQQEALRESEEKYRILVESSPFGITSSHNNILKFVNPAFVRMFGYKNPNDLIGTSIGKIFAPDQREMILQRGIRRMKGFDEPLSYESVGLRRDGIKFPIAVSVAIPNNKDPSTITMLLEDISDKKKAEKELRESSERYMFLFESSPLGIVIVRQKVILYANERFVKMYGYENKNDVVNHLIGSFQVPELREKLTQRGLNREQGGIAPTSYDSIGLKWNGTRFHIHVEVNQINLEDGPAILTFIQDITDRKRDELALKESEEKFRNFVETSQDLIWQVDNERKFVYLNPAWEEVLGYNVNEMLGKKFTDFKKPDVIVRDLITFQEYLKGGQVKDFHTIYLTKNGQEVHLSLNAIPIRNHQNEMIGAQGTAHNITQIKLMEEEMNKYSKLESLGILAGGIAHDFNNLLTGISGNISLALLAANKPADSEIYLHEAESALQRASKLTDQLLIFSKGGVPSMEKVAVGQIIKESTRFILRGSNVRSQVVIADDLWIVEIDTGQINQVIQNVVINGSQAMSEGGTIEIRATNISIEENQLRGLKAGDYICIAIQDHGLGIPENQVNKIFDPFFTTKTTGSGLGLTTSYSIIQKHEGYIDIESEVGQGTTVSIYLPAISTETIDTKSNMRESGKKMAIKNYSGNILVMDDEPTVQKVFNQMLQKLGFNIDVVSDGEQAIHNYEASLNLNNPFDLVVLDLTISGGMGGKETIKHLKALNPAIKAIVSSGYSNDPILANFKEYGFQEKLVKPFTFERLRTVLNSLNL